MDDFAPVRAERTFEIIANKVRDQIETANSARATNFRLNGRWRSNWAPAEMRSAKP